MNNTYSEIPKETRDQITEESVIAQAKLLTAGEKAGAEFLKMYCDLREREEILKMQVEQLKKQIRK